MGAPNRTSSDIPEFATYPSSPSDQLLSAHDSDALRTASYGEPAYGEQLTGVAREVGTRLGEGMNAVQSLRDRAVERIAGLRDSFEELYSNARERSLEVGQEKFDMLRDGSREQLHRAKQYAEERPLAVIAAAGIAGVLIGAGVRAWRGNRG